MKLRLLLPLGGLLIASSLLTPAVTLSLIEDSSERLIFEARALGNRTPSLVPVPTGGLIYGGDGGGFVDFAIFGDFAQGETSDGLRVSAPFGLANISGFEGAEIEPIEGGFRFLYGAPLTVPQPMPDPGSSFALLLGALGGIGMLRRVHSPTAAAG